MRHFASATKNAVIFSMLNVTDYITLTLFYIIHKIVAAFRGMHVSPAKHSFGKCDRKVWQTDGQTDRRTDWRTTDKVIPMCRYASQATQSVTDGRTDRQTDRLTDKVIPMCRYASQATQSVTDRRTDRQTDRRRTKWSLCVAMLRRRHNNPVRQLSCCFGFHSNSITPTVITVKSL